MIDNACGLSIVAVRTRMVLYAMTNLPKITVALCFLLLGIALLAPAQTKMLTTTSAFTIPAALDVVPERSNLYVEVAPGSVGKAELRLSVGTNDWPLELRLGIIKGLAGVDKLNLMYQFRKAETGEAHLWVTVPDFKNLSPITLPSPAWTEYVLSLRVSTPCDATPGRYECILRLNFRCQSGLVEIREIPVCAFVPQPPD